MEDVKVPTQNLPSAFDYTLPEFTSYFSGREETTKKHLE
jgi:hypothetical protein